MQKQLDSIRAWYGRYEQTLSSLFLVLGFAIDAFTLRRVDALWENLWIFGHIVIIAIFIVLIHTGEKEDGAEANPSKKHFWYVNILQFFFGGLLSANLVFYFRSADIFTTWPFIVLLAVAIFLNEKLKRHYVRFSFQIGLLFFSIYSFSIYIMPVMLDLMSPTVFVLSGVASLITILIFISIFFYFKESEFKESKRLILTIIFSIFGIVNLLYFTNLIPPIPLSIKDAGIYNSVTKNAAGDFETVREKTTWRDYFKLYKDFHKVEGFPVYAFSAIFSPPGLDLVVVHEWQHYEETKKIWVTESRVSLPVVGGREGGFRTYSMKSNLPLGDWRVNVETIDGQVIGRLRFTVLPKSTELEYVNEIK